MARRYETITELYHETIAGLAAPQVWQSFSDHGLSQFPPAL